MIMMACNNKGCHEIQDAKLDEGTNKVMCSMCNREISNISDFMKASMKSQGQTLSNLDKGLSSRKPFAIKCTDCGKMDTPNIKFGKPYCTSCQRVMSNVSPPLVIMIDQYLKNKKDL